MTSQLDRLDDIALKVAKGNLDSTGALSTGERVYVALAANSVELLDAHGYTIAEALARLGPEWTQKLIVRWQYRGSPKKVNS